MNKYSDKVLASLLIGSYLDTLGFGNGDWEFNFNYKKDLIDIDIALLIWTKIVHEYFSLGGSNIDISKWYSSDDTILMMIICSGCLDGGSNENYLNSFKKKFKVLKNDIRASGVTTILSLKKMFKIKDIKKMDYNINMGGNGAAVRTSSIGLIYYKEEDIDMLIKNSINSSRITHNYTHGFLSGFVNALFTSYAVRDILPINWVTYLLKLYESGKIDNFMKETNIYKKYLRDKDSFWNLWYEYNEKRINKKKVNFKIDEFYNNKDRIKSLSNYTPGIKFNKESIDYRSWGSSGIGALIISLDSLINSASIVDDDIYYNWDSLVYFSTLHFGDSDSTGILAGCWYGALTGFSIVNEKKMKQLEFYKELKNLGNKIIKKNN
tara:strand:- start:307 stop:1443 length:1137 start_codon:yes stop_codon:yes gene_type:complete